MKIPFLRAPDRHMREVAVGTAIALVTRSAGAALQFLLSVVIARWLGAEGAGLFFLALTVMMLGTVFGRLGLDNALLRFVSAGAGVGDWPEVQGVYRRSMAFALASSLVTILVLNAAAPALAVHVLSKPDLIQPLRTMALALVPTAIVLLYAEAIKGLKRILASQLLQGVAMPGLALVFLWLAVPRGSVIDAVRAYVAGTAAAALAAIVAWRRLTPVLRRLRGDFETRRLLRASLPLLWVASIHLMMGWAGTLFLGVWATSADVGIFAAAYRTALLATLVLLAVSSIAAPKFAELYRRGEHATLRATARRSTALTALLAAPLVLVFLIAPGHVLALFGPEFREGGLVLAILAAGQFVYVATGSAAYLLMMSGHERLLRDSIALAGALNVALNLALIPWAGRVGAAAATALSIAALNLIAAYFVHSRLGIRFLPLPPLPGSRRGEAPAP